MLNAIYTELVGVPAQNMDPDVETAIEGIETAFNVILTDSQIGDEPTFEGVYAALRSTTSTSTTHRCLASIVFWRLRGSMMEMSGLPKDAIRLDTPVESLINPFRRRQAWRSISEKTGLRLPGLEFSPRFTYLLFALMFASVATILWIVKPDLSDLVAIPILGVATPLIGAALFWLARPFAVTPPAHSLTMRDLVRTVVGLNHGSLCGSWGHQPIASFGNPSNTSFETSRPSSTISR